MINKKCYSKVFFVLLISMFLCLQFISFAYAAQEDSSLLSSVGDFFRNIFGGKSITGNPIANNAVCGQAVMSSLTLNGDLECGGSGNGLVVGNNGVTINCNGYTIRNVTIGVYSSERSNILVQNCNIENTDKGIFFGGASSTNNNARDNNITLNQPSTNGQYGIRYENRVANGLVDNNRIIGGGIYPIGGGIAVWAGCTGITVQNNIVENALQGIWGCCQSSGIVIKNNEVYNANQYGIRNYGGVDFTIEDNLVDNTNGYGIEDYRTGGATSTIVRNIVRNSGTVGIVSLGTIPSLIYDNYLNNTNNYADGGNSQILNVALDCNSGPNIYGGECIGGNYWATPNGDGYSQNCEDLGYNGICDDPYLISAYSTDNFPLTDEGIGVPVCDDGDGDDYGVCPNCGTAVGCLYDGNDCNDNNILINPGAAEVCNGVDDDCDGQTDEGGVCPSIDYYCDGDSDGGISDTSSASCNTFDCVPALCSAAQGNDCDDGDSLIYFGQTEVCDTIDNNCNGQIDEGVKTIFYQDSDTDGYGDVFSTVDACSAPVGYVSDSTDCNDGNGAINPGETEVCNGVDDNCNLQTDEGVKTTFYLDSDTDGYGDVFSTVDACSAPVGYVSDSTDCDDGNSAIKPGATEVCDGEDNDCDGQDDEGGVCMITDYYCDMDLDGHISSTPEDNCDTFDCVPALCSATQGNDCNDGNGQIYFGQTEVCDTIDNNCNGQIDEGVKTTFYLDSDTDGYGDVFSTVDACSAPAGYVADNTDCDDGDTNVNPGKSEACNGIIDDNCDGQVDEGGVCPTIDYYCDDDGDTYFDELIDGTCNTFNCVSGSCQETSGNDCDDDNDQIYFGRTEVCNDIDDDCDGQTDEGGVCPSIDYYCDGDSDGGISDTSSASCNTFDCVPALCSATQGNDCNDGNGQIYFGQTEVCNGVDDDCDLEIDEGVVLRVYSDSDNDGFGNPLSHNSLCELEQGYSLDNTDCDDTRANVNPDATEICDLVDNDCDAQIDEGVKITFYQDSDSDSFGNSLISEDACSAPVNYVIDNTDCNDDVFTINPGATEVCNEVDDDCDGSVNEALPIYTLYINNDGDDYGNSLISQETCHSSLSGWESIGGDCNDNNISINPGATEVCNEVDDDCDTQVDEGVLSSFYQDSDSDGFGSPFVYQTTCNAPDGYVYDDNTDCDDTRSNVNPDATEVCNGIDDDCDGQTDEGGLCSGTNYYCDKDIDGYFNVVIDGTCDTFNCVPVECTAVQGDDCNDDNDAINPGEAELCDGIDQNCDAQSDEGGVCPLVTYYCDVDSDGYFNMNSNGNCDTFDCVPAGCQDVQGDDCVDVLYIVNPGRVEVCDGLDSDCNALTPDGSGEIAPLNDYQNGVCAGSTKSCTSIGIPPHWTNDYNSITNYQAIETVCDTLDNDCDGSVDEGLASTYYFDGDEDNYGNFLISQDACSAPANYVTDNTDCNDDNLDINPGKIEICDGIDQNCDVQIDEGNVCNVTNYYCDNDSDGYFASSPPTGNCDTFDCVPAGCQDVQGDDCADYLDWINPGEAELCDGIDQNCKGDVDEGLDHSGPDNTNQLGVCLDSVQSCVGGSWQDDYSGIIDYEQISEATCDTLDNDCDNSADEGLTNIYYEDVDGDQYGNVNVVQDACSAPINYVTDSTDCNDGNPSINPGATDFCNGIEENCNAIMDDNGCPIKTYYCDNDSDTYFDELIDGSCDTFNCISGACRESQGNDCDDLDNAIKPGVIESCNGIDDNCDGQVDEGNVCGETEYYCDNDSDTYFDINVDGTCTGFNCVPAECREISGDDCNDGSDAINPVATEVCDGVDNDCNGQTDEGVLLSFYKDADHDGYGRDDLNVSMCELGLGASLVAGDCNDGSSSIYPGAPELCDNGIDDNCNAQPDCYELSCETYPACAGQCLGYVNTEQISNCCELQLMKDNLNGNYELVGDIDCSDTVDWNLGSGFAPVGTIADAFTGNLSGNGNTITGLYINRTSQTYVGLFSSVAPLVADQSLIRNIHMENFDITGSSNVGSLSGRLTRAVKVIDSTFSNGVVRSPNLHVGGIASELRDGAEISNCNVQNTDVSAMYYVGGLVGTLYSGISYSTKIENSEFSGNIYSITPNWYSFYSGGIAGSMGGPGEPIINNCTVASDAVIEGGYGVGGVVGSQISGNSIISNSKCYADINLRKGSGAIGIVGGIVGTQYGIVDNCLYDGAIDVQNFYSANNTGGIVGILISSGQVLNSESHGTILAVNSIGGIAGNENGTGGYIADCWSDINITTLGSQNIGGIKGVNRGSVIRSHFNGTITSNEGVNVGGVVGYNADPSAVIEDSYFAGTIIGAENVGGIVGYNDANVTTSYSSGDVNDVGNSNVGGIVGYNGPNGVIIDSFSTSEITSASGNNVGGVVGNNAGGYIVNSYWYDSPTDDAQTCVGNEASACDNNVQTDVTYFYEITNAPLNAWDFVSIWEETDGLPGIYEEPPIVYDEDQDGVLDEYDKCSGTVPWYSQELRPNHYDSSNMNLVSNYGCSCEQILYCKPGNNGGEEKWGCTDGTLNVWTTQTGWSLDCQLGGFVSVEGESKPIFENTDNTDLPDIFDGDNDNDGIIDEEDSEPESAPVEAGKQGKGKPDWWCEKNPNKC